MPPMPIRLGQHGILVPLFVAPIMSTNMVNDL
jgi:hypothetical protein